MQIITEEDYKQYYNKDLELKEEEKLVVAAVNNHITNALGFSADSNQQDVITAVPNRKKYFLSSPTVESIEKVELSGVEVPYVAYLKQGIIELLTPPATQSTLVIEYVDMGLDNIPEDLKLAAILLCEHYIKQNYRNSISMGGQNIQFNSTKAGIPEHIRSILELYRRL